MGGSHNLRQLLKPKWVTKRKLLLKHGMLFGEKTFQRLHQMTAPMMTPCMH